VDRAVLDIAYRDLVTRPVNSVRAVYERFSLPYTNGFHRALTRAATSAARCAANSAPTASKPAPRRAAPPRAIADRVGKNAKAALGKHERSGTRMAHKAKGTS